MMLQSSIKISFRQELVELPLERLTALKEPKSQELGSRTCKQLRASLKHVGLVEPLAVFPQGAERFLVVNGNLRLYLLRELGIQSARCTVALDDESYTYNKRVNALSPITEHFMILKAIANGVTEERIAEGLDIDVKAIKNRRNLLDGICPEVVELLKEKRVGSRTFGYLRRMKPLRQIEAAELMISGKNYTVSFAAAIFGVTSQEQLVKPSKAPSNAAKSQSSGLLEETTGNIVGELAVARRTYGADVLALTVICRSLEKLIENEEVGKYLQHNHPGILGELQDLVSEVNAERAITQ
jgi:RepB plasmid partitioning protein